MSSEPRVLVMAGDGINCEFETSAAFCRAGFRTEIRHLNDLISEQLSLDQLQKQYSVLALPGGFAFADDLSAGRILGLKISHGLGWDLSRFVQTGGLVIGICNGFQALIRMGVFGRSVSITANENGKFINQWVGVTPSGTKCVWLRGLGSLELPIRHGEGRLVFHPENRLESLNKLERQGSLCLRYDQNLNGSEESLAGLCDSSGRIFGLMPHPEAYIRWTAHPNWTSQPSRAGSPGEGLAFFENAFKEARSST